MIIKFLKSFTFLNCSSKHKHRKKKDYLHAKQLPHTKKESFLTFLKEQNTSFIQKGLFMIYTKNYRFFY